MTIIELIIIIAILGIVGAIVLPPMNTVILGITALIEIILFIAIFIGAKRNG